MFCLYFSLTSPFLFLSLHEGEHCLISFQKENYRLHADNFLTHLKIILKQVNRSLAELREIYFTSFPSGQTGLRVSLTFLTTLQALNPKVKLYHINTLYLQAGGDNCLSLLTLDSRESKYYAAVYQQKHCLLTPRLVSREELTSLMKQFNGFSVRKDFRGVDFESQFRVLKNEFTLLKKITEINL
jgi:tRNA A37 threonylcarbamoyladenosine modification protein TsaB